MKQKIIQESILLFERKGFGSTSIQDIVDALNVTKGTFYYYFSSKEQLLMDIHSEYIEDLLKRQAAIIEKPGTFREKLHDIVYLLIADIEAQGLPAGYFSGKCGTWEKTMRKRSGKNGIHFAEILSIFCHKE